MTAITQEKQSKTAAKPHSVLPLPHQGHPRPKLLIGLVATNLLLLVGVIATILLGRAWIKEERAVVAEEKRLLTEALAKQATEFEQLRVDVVTTSSVNSVFLKILLLKPGMDKNLARDIAHAVVMRAREHHRDPDLVLSIIDVESDFNPNVVSNMGAMGLMQIMPAWKKDLGIQQDLRDVDTSINYGLKILGLYENTYGTLEMALTAYNKGPVQVNADLKAGRSPFNGYSDVVLKTYSRIKSWMRP